MLKTRVIPCLLMKNGGIYKTISFADPKYIGDPINTVRIFNEKEVDELILLDIEVSKKNHEPNYEQIQDIVSEAFMPIAYGGGITRLDQAQKIISLGIEKVIINTAAIKNIDLVREISEKIGSSSTVIAVDVNKNWLGRYCVYRSDLGKNTDVDLISYIQEAVSYGAGEIFVNAVYRDGTLKGYDLDLVRKICSSVDVPVISCGGAKDLEDFKGAAELGASGVAAGSLFVYIGKHRAVMINYPSQQTLNEVFKYE